MEYTISMGRSKKVDFYDVSVAHFIDELKLGRSNWQLIVTSESGLNKSMKCAGHTMSPVPGVVIVTVDSKLKFDAALQVLAHEMVHVKQFVTGKFRVAVKRGRPEYTWVGRRVSNKVHYYDQPWEKQAYGAERLLVNSFIKRYEKDLAKIAKK